MKRVFLNIVFLVLATGIYAQTYTMSTSSVTTCSGTFYDSGNSGGNYGNNQNRTMTFCSGTGQTMVFEFTSFNTEANWDFLYVYDGADISAPLIGTYTGNLGAGVGTITSTGTCLTFRFTSDGSVTRAGWVANISCGAPIIPPDCNWQICLVDSYGDGWNGGSVQVSVGGTVTGTYTLGSGSGPACYNIPLYEGEDIFVNYTAGSWSGENEYYLYDSHGYLVYSSGSGGVTPVDYTYTAADCEPHPVTPNEQDCLGAIPICGDTYYTEESYSGTGNVPNEINGANSCLSGGEINDVWYVFTVQQDGDLMFTLTPNDLSDDYDWAVYNLTTSTCSDIFTDASLEVSCNWSGTAGVTGPDGSTAFSSQDDTGTPFNAAIPVLEGEIYVINISNWSSTQNGYFIDFSMASGVIVDVTPPELDTIVNTPTCGQDLLTLWFNEPVDTATVEPDDFVVNGPGGPYSIVTTVGTSGTSSDREYELTLDAQLIAGGTYTLVFSGQVDDACGNSVIGNSLSFTVEGVSGAVVVDDDAVICYDDAVGILTASGSGGSGSYSYLWSTGAATAQITNLPAGDYTVTVTDDVGVCYDIVTATVEPANAGLAVGVWTGVDNNDWYNCGNWGSGTIPEPTSNVDIPGGCPNYPKVTENYIINSATGHSASVRIRSGAEMVVDDDKNFTLNNGLLLVENNGKITITGNLTINTGAMINQTGGEIELEGNFVVDDEFSATGGEITFSGSLLQTISGSYEPVFNDFMVNNAAGVRLLMDIEVKGNLKMNTGNLNLNTSNCNLGSSGELMFEVDANRITAVDGMGIPSSGTITATRVNPTGNVAGLGLEISPTAALGNTTITRGHQEQTGTGTYSGNSSILRYYEVVPGAKAVIPSDLVMNYFDWELNGHTDGDLVMFQEVQYSYGGTPGPVYWQPLGTVNDAFLNTAVATTSDNMLSYFKITLGSSTNPLPVEFLSAEAECNEGSVNIKWVTASEINNDYFAIEKSFDATSWAAIGKVQGAGNSSESISYLFVDNNNSEQAYYRIKQVDFDEKYAYSEIIASNCRLVKESEVKIFSIEEAIILQGYLSESGSYSIAIFDICGKMIYSENSEFDTGIFQNNIPAGNFSEGVYLVKMYNTERLFTGKVILR
ncbi:MAG: Ig-like domain-containing protein [Bacteroidales bacterium]|nr:Ig-like domain-containing protein [Bacteroidales bacterium]